MVASPKARTENVRWELTQLPNRLPEQWRKWRDNNLSRMARVRRLTQPVGTDSFTPLRGLIVVTSWSKFAAGDQFIMAIPSVNAGAPRQFLCEVRFARRSPANTWTVGTRILGSLKLAKPMESANRFAA